MTAKWQVGSVPIYISEKSQNREIKRAELFPLDATASSYQFFGAGSRHYSVKGIVTSGSYYTDLENYAITNSAFNFLTPWGTIPNCKIHKEVKGTTVRYSGGVFDGVNVSVDVDELTEVELELIIP